MDELKMFDIVFVKISSDKRGSEQSGIHPYVIIQNNIGNMHSPTILGMSLTSSLKKENMPTHCILHKSDKNGLKRDSMLLGETITQISKERIIKKIGYVDDVKEQKKVFDVFLANATGKKKYNSFWQKTLYKLFFLIVKENNNGNAA